MRNLCDPADRADIERRIALLRPDSERLWGKMNAPQAIAHCAEGVRMALGELKPPRKFVGRLIGPFVKKLVLRDDEPFRRNSPTVDELIIRENRDLATERDRLCALINRFAAAWPKGCTAHPHSFFGPLTPTEWAALMYKHLDHHLRQFGV